MLTMIDLCNGCQLDPDAVENWLRRLELRTPYQQIRRGQRRLFTLDNALELTFIWHLVSCGVTPARAVPFADALRCNAQGPSGALRDWLMFRAGTEPTEGIATNNPDMSTLEGELAGRGPIILVPVGRIAREVKALYEASAAR